MRLHIISTGSMGNCYVLTRDNEEKVILDCGVPVREIMKALDYDLKSVRAVLHTHFHGDHSIALQDLERMGLNVISPCKMNIGSAMAGDWIISCFALPHNGTKNYGFVIQVDGKTILYLTDFEYCPYTFKNYKPDYIIVECNYQKEYVDENIPNLVHKVMGHCELNTTKEFVMANKTENLKDVVIVHTSNACNRDEIKEIIGKESSCLVHIAQAGMDIDLQADVPF